MPFISKYLKSLIIFAIFHVGSFAYSSTWHSGGKSLNSAVWHSVGFELARFFKIPEGSCTVRKSAENKKKFLHK